jgi:hypothetical protein
VKKAASVKSTKSSRQRSAPPSDDDSPTEDEELGRKPHSRKQSMVRHKSDASMKSRKSEKDKDEKRSHSRTPSKSARKRTESSATANGNAVPIEREDSNSKRRSIAGWMSSIGRSKTKDSFSALNAKGVEDMSEDEDEDEDEPPKRPPSSFSNKSSKSGKSKAKSDDAPRIASRSVATVQKRVKALYDFSGSSDELSFKTGDEIVVLNEVMDDWWMGEMDGKKGLFPSTYTEVITGSKPPPLPTRPRTNSKAAPLAIAPHLEATRPDQDADSYLTSDADDDHPFGDHMLVTHARTPIYNTFGDADSMLSSAAEDEEERGLMKKKPDSAWDDPEPTINRRTTPHVPSRRGSELGSSNSLGKKAPPPPPPRRANSTFHASASSLSSTPDKRASLLLGRSHSNSSASTSQSISALAAATTGMHESPFDESVGAWAGPCRDFKQNPFKPRGMCSNCFQMHE